MKLRLDSARSGPFVWEESVPLDAVVGDAPGSEPLRATVRGRLSPPDPEQWLDLDVEFRSLQPCDRCTRPVETAVRSITRLLVERGRRAAEAGEVELSEEELGVVEVAGGELDTTPLVVEQVLLELPTRPLCRDDCRGLCPVCGGDRNERECDCASEAIDPRWSGLAALKGRLGAPD